MDFIKAEIESKKRSLDQLSLVPSTSSSSSDPPSKYIKRADLERQRIYDLKQQEEQDRLAKLVTSHSKNGKGKGATSSKEESSSTLSLDSSSTSTSLATNTTSTEDNNTGRLESFNVTAEEAVRRLRAKGQPIRLFAETDKERRLRLRALELIEERTDGQQNDFARAMDGMEMGLELHKLEMEAKGRVTSKEDNSTTKKGKDVVTDQVDDEDEDKEKKPKDEEVLIELALVKTNPHKIYPQVYFALKRVLKEWEQSLSERPDAIRRSTQGKIAAATQQTSAEYLKPLFKSLRKRDLAPDVLLAISEITYNMQIREYLKANDAYLRLSIGNAPWPIGVTMVGIHERAGREKIFSNNVGHVLNDETSRKYIQSLKRLLTFAQTIRPPDDGSQKMG